MLRLFVALCVVLGMMSPGRLSDQDPAEVVTVAQLIGTPDFQRENIPTRVLRVVVFADESLGRYYSERVIRNASDILLEQVGITLFVSEYIIRGIPNERSLRVITPALRYHAMRNDFDVLIIMSTSFPREKTECGDEWCVVGVAYCRRYIHLRTEDPKILAHEVVHVFLGGKPHSLAGLMHKVPVSPYLTISDRKDLLQNKSIDLSGYRMEQGVCTQNTPQ